MGKRKPNACLPIGCVVTIAAAGSEMSSSTVVTNEENGFKRSFKTDMARPAFAVMMLRREIDIVNYGRLFILARVTLFKPRWIRRCGR